MLLVHIQTTEPISRDTFIGIVFLLVIAVSVALLILLRLLTFLRRRFGGDVLERIPDDGQTRSVEACAPVVLPDNRQGVINPLDLPLRDRLQTIIVGRTGDGKTQAQIAMMVADIARGYEVAWLSTHLALYNERDQPTDLRPLRSHVVQIYTPDAICAALATAAHLVTERMPLYRENQPHGHPIVLYLDEWPDLVRIFGDTIVSHLITILQQGRTVDITVVLAATDGLTDTLGMKSGVRELFKTRLIGNVDAATWLALVGKGVPRRTIPPGQGIWHVPLPTGDIATCQMMRPSPRRIAQLAAHPPQPTASCTQNAHAPAAAAAAPRLTEQHIHVAAWLTEARPAIADLISAGKSYEEARRKVLSDREIARRLFPQSGTGGGDYAMQAGRIRRDVEAVFGAYVEAVDLVETA